MFEILSKFDIHISITFLLINTSNNKTDIIVICAKQISAFDKDL